MNPLRYAGQAAGGDWGRALRLSRACGVAPMACALVASVVAAGCSGLPAQEMSDARQAIRAAQAAGAAKVAPATLADAQDRLKRAEEALRIHEYRDARREAEGANARAREALRAAETQPLPAVPAAPTTLPPPRA